MLPAPGGKHIFEGQPIAFFIKNTTFWTLWRKEKEPFTSLCSLLSLLCPFGSPFCRSMLLLPSPPTLKNSNKIKHPTQSNPKAVTHSLFLLPLAWVGYGGVP